MIPVDTSFGSIISQGRCRTGKLLDMERAYHPFVIGSSIGEDPEAQLFLAAIGDLPTATMAGMTKFSVYLDTAYLTWSRPTSMSFIGRRETDAGASSGP